MATIRLTRREIDRDWLPDVCVLTGRPTEERWTKTLSAYAGPPGVLVFGPIGFLLLLLIRKSVTLDLPMLSEKRNHWGWRTLTGLGVMLSGFGTMIVGIGLRGPRFQAEEAAGPVILIGLVLQLAGLITWMSLSNASLRVKRIELEFVTLTNVHPLFKAAVLEMRAERAERRRAEEDAEDQEEEERRERRRRERDEAATGPRRRAKPVSVRPPADAAPTPEGENGNLPLPAD